MKLTPHRPDTMGLYVTGQDQYGNYLSMWRTIHNPSEYQSALDDVAIVSYLSNALQHDVGDTGAIENYFKGLDFLKLPSDELEDFAIYCGDILFENSPADFEIYCYSLDYEVYLHGQQHHLAYSIEDLEMAFLRLYIRWRYKSK